MSLLTVAGRRRTGGGGIVTPPPTGGVASDSFTGDGPLGGRLATDRVNSWSAAPGWNTAGGAVTLTGNTNDGTVAILAHLNHEYARISSTMTYTLMTGEDRSHPAIVFRYKDVNNYCIAELHPEVVLIRQVVAGTWTTLGFPALPAPLASGAPAKLTVDLYVDAFVLEVNGTPLVNGQPFSFVSPHDFAQHTGVGMRYEHSQSWGATAWARWDDFEVAETTRTKLNWPRFWATGTRVFPDIPLGPAGAWDSTDVNNPNVLPNPSGGWLMSYTGYYNDGVVPGDEIQEMGIATAPSLDGPWTKAAGNPSFSEPGAQKWNINGGMVYVPSASTYVQVYGTGTNAGGSGIATSTDLETWTIKTPIPGGGHDNTMRLREDGVTVEVYFKRSSPVHGIWRASSSDLGDTWTVDTDPIVLPPAWFNPGTPSFSEVGVYVPPGKEGEQMVIAIDRTENGRSSYLGVTVDGGVTWQWMIGNRGPSAATGAGDKARFDPFLAYSAGYLYLYYGGTDASTITLNGAIQIGHIRVPWDPAELVRV